MSKTETISTREFAAIVGHSHGNICRILEGMLKRGELNLRVSQYRNKPGGKKFDEYHLKLTDANLLNGRLGEKYQRAWAEYIQSCAPRGAADNAGTQYSQPAVLNVPSVSHPVRAGVTRIVSPLAEGLTMSSLEIAELTGKDHKNVIRDVRKMLDELGDGSNLSHVKILQNSRGHTSEIRLQRREVDILLTGYSTPMRAAVIDRWRELEAEVAKPVFNVPTSFADALRLAGELEEQRVALTHQVSMQAVKIAEDAPKIATYTKLVDSRGSINFQQFCTKLNLHQVKVKEWLRDIGWLRENQWEVNPLPTAKAVDGGYCVIKDFILDDGRLVQSIKFTGKAETYVYEKAPDYIRKKVRAARQTKGKKAA